MPDGSLGRVPQPRGIQRPPFTVTVVRTGAEPVSIFTTEGQIDEYVRLLGDPNAVLQYTSSDGGTYHLPVRHIISVRVAETVQDTGLRGPGTYTHEPSINTAPASPWMPTTTTVDNDGIFDPTTPPTRPLSDDLQ